MKRKFISTAVAIVIVFISLQFIHPKIKNPTVISGIKAPADIESILRRACYDCHSYETNLRWYDKIEPVYWQVADDVKNGRKALNFSEWQNMMPAEQKAKLWEAINQIATSAMPPQNYLIVHPTAKLSQNDLTILKNYVSSMQMANKPGDTAKINAAILQCQQWQTTKALSSKLPMAPNGIAYIPDYKNWQVVSTTDRFDNGTIRIIFGNDIAVKAIKQNEIHPWPNGTILAKVAWDQIEDTAGDIHIGAFRQVEYMIKNDQKYTSTEGWGFARFKTYKLLPYGETALFTSECMNCHRPMKDEDFVFTQPIKN